MNSEPQQFDQSATPERLNCNVGLRLSVQASNFPDSLGIASPVGSHRQGTNRAYRTLSLRDLDVRSSTIASGLANLGIEPGKRIGLLVRFGADFITLVFAILKTGATLILIDPGMGRSNAIRCLEETQPDGFIAIPVAHALLGLMRSRFPKAKLNVTVGPRFGLLPSPTLNDLERKSSSQFEVPITSASDAAAIIFTTGSTGPPKGVLYTHQTFNSQIDQVASHYHVVPGGLDLSGFPLFGLFNAVMGTGTVLPDMNPIRPADVDPVRLLDAIDQWQVNQSFGSPALWTKVGSYCERIGRKVPSLRCVLSAGAPVPPRILEQMRRAMHPDGTMHTPYGATEALPISSIESRVVLGETAARTRNGAGTCVGSRFSGIEWKVIEITDGPIVDINQIREVPRGSVGELMVTGPVVSTQYMTRIDQNAIHKVRDGERVWHRMGDVGYFDDQDRFWFCGRKGHRVVSTNETLFTEPVEAIINTHPKVYRSALVGRGTAPEQKPVVIIEPWPKDRRDIRKNPSQFLREIRELAQTREATKMIEEFVIYPSKLPTDIRHNSKIFREKLSKWIATHSCPS